MNDSTVHRILRSLSKSGLVQQRSQDRRYAIGPLCFELALSQAPYFAFQRECLAYLNNIARVSGWHAYAFLKSGTETVCIQRLYVSSEQSMVDVGMRRPLAGTAYGIAILLSMSATERKSALLDNRRALRLLQESNPNRHYGEMLKVSKERGFGLNINMVANAVGSIGIPLLDSRHVPYGAFGVSGSHKEFSPARIARAVASLRNEATAIAAEQPLLVEEMTRMHH